MVRRAAELATAQDWLACDPTDTWLPEPDATLLAEGAYESALNELKKPNPNNQKALWPKFGYEGSSFEHGGYLHRGFNDLDWLPDPRVTEAE